MRRAREFAEGLDEVQRRAHIGAESNDVSGVRRDLRLDENDLQHGVQ